MTLEPLNQKELFLLTHVTNNFVAPARNALLLFALFFTSTAQSAIEDSAHGVCNIKTDHSHFPAFNRRTCPALTTVNQSPCEENETSVDEVSLFQDLRLPTFKIENKESLTRIQTVVVLKQLRPWLSSIPPPFTA